MSFVNEYVSEQDIITYQLDHLLNKYVETKFDEYPQEHFKHKWTIDRSKNIFLVEAKMIEEVGPSGRQEPTNRSIFVLSIDGEQIDFELEKRSDSSKKLSESPFKINWQVLKQRPNQLANLTGSQITDILIEAITCFGYAGPRKQIPNTVVTVINS